MTATHSASGAALRAVRDTSFTVAATLERDSAVGILLEDTEGCSLTVVVEQHQGEWVTAGVLVGGHRLPASRRGCADRGGAAGASVVTQGNNGRRYRRNLVQHGRFSGHRRSNRHPRIGSGPGDRASCGGRVGVRAATCPQGCETERCCAHP